MRPFKVMIKKENNILGGHLMKKKLLIFSAVTLIAVFLLSTFAFGAVATKDLRVYYRNIKIKVNGKIIDVGEDEPFIYNNRTYVPIRFVSEALDKVVEWDNNQNIVVINDKSPSELSQQLAAKDAEIQRLTYQSSLLQSKIIELQKTIEDLEKEKKNKKENASAYLKDYLYDEYSEWKDIEFDFTVKESKGNFTLTIKFDRSDFKSEWNKLSESKITNWLEDIYEFVKDEFPDAGFKGTIYDTNAKKDLVEFEESKNKLKVKFYDSGKSYDLDDLEDDLNYYFGSGLSTYHKKFGKLTADIIVEESDDDEIYITIVVNTSKYPDEWDAVRDTDAADDWLYDIMEFAYEELEDYAIYGHVENSKGKTQATFKCTKSGKMTIDWE